VSMINSAIERHERKHSNDDVGRRHIRSSEEEVSEK
jgi:hypothetical protein